MAPPRDTAGVIAPPPLLFLGTLLLALAIGRLWQGVPTRLPWPARALLALALLAGAVALLAGALGRFRAARTPPQPWKPTKAIVDTGVYGVTRNPMYVAFTLVYAALALALDSGLALLLLPALLLLVQWGVIAREERYLEAKFGDEYRAYRGRVRRWL
jgi:protein-S-isoprenylcysteine O-methyltransferase Ste14